MVGIGFFAPFPLALMIPFMAGQSLAMGEAFGKGFQYGKRKISSMSNEEFNALDFKGLSESLATDYRVMIPSLEKSIRASDTLQRAVFEAFGDIIATIPDVVKNFMNSSSGGNITNPTAEHETLVTQTETAIDTGGQPGGTSAWFLLGINSVLDIWHYLGVDNTEFKKLYHSSAETVFRLKSKQKLMDLQRDLIASGAYDRFINRQGNTATGPGPSAGTSRKEGLYKTYITAKNIHEKQIQAVASFKNAISKNSLQLKKFQAEIIAWGKLPTYMKKNTIQRYNQLIGLITKLAITLKRNTQDHKNASGLLIKTQSIMQQSLVAFNNA